MNIVNQPKQLEWTSENISSFWNGCAQTRLMEYSFGKLAAESLILTTWSFLPEDGLILDFGAGDGDIVEALLDKGFKVAAYEPSINRRNISESKFKGNRNYYGLIDDDTNVKFDLIILCEVIEHLLDSELTDVLKKVGSLLKQDGKIIITTPNNEDIGLDICYCPTCNTTFHRWQHVRSFSGDSLKETLMQINIEPIVIHYTKFDINLFEPYSEILVGNKRIPKNYSGENRDKENLWSILLRKIYAMFGRINSAYHVLINKQKIIIPDYVYKILNNETAYISDNTNILYIGKWKS